MKVSYDVLFMPKTLRILFGLLLQLYDPLVQAEVDLPERAHLYLLTLFEFRVDLLVLGCLLGLILKALV